MSEYTEPDPAAEDVQADATQETAADEQPPADPQPVDEAGNPIPAPDDAEDAGA